MNRLLPLRPGTGLLATVFCGEDDGKASPPSGTEGTGARTEGGLTRARVLVVEDELLVAWEVSELLGTLGHTICGLAATAEEAVRLAVEQRPDLILMDVTLRGPRDGIDAATAIRAKHPVRIVYVTAHSDPTTRARMEATGPEGILHKPYTDGELERAISEALTRRSRQ